MNTVIDTIVSVGERDKLLNFLDRFLQNIYNLHLDVKSMISTDLPENTANALIQYLGNDLETRDVEGILDKCITLEHEMDQVPVVGLTIAFEPQPEFMRQVSEVICQKRSEKCFISFSVDRSIVGGAVIEGNGTVMNDTVKKYFIGKGIYGI